MQGAITSVILLESVRVYLLFYGIITDYAKRSLDLRLERTKMRKDLADVYACSLGAFIYYKFLILILLYTLGFYIFPHNQAHSLQ